ncbi:Probable glycosyltransferase At5g03795 [Durusdinium trenchii]|uniref:Probable glycosyltransferase At5g03795 n=1 Tax=Durusdinium trenchii TaxID=1381693 RepID=A0ABP0KXR6_9DINO
MCRHVPPVDTAIRSMRDKQHEPPCDRRGFVPDGFSSISARLYEVLLHGCVPVLLTHAFHPPFERLVDWRRLAIFLRNSEVAEAPAILRNISEEDYLAMHREVVRARRLLNVHDMPFWIATNLDLQLRRRT